MVTSSDQIRTGYAGADARTTTRWDQADYTYAARQPATAGGGIAEQVRRRPLLALGLSLIAGSLLQDYFGGESAPSTPRPVGRSSYTSFDAAPATGAYRPATGGLRQEAREAVDAAGDAMQSAGQTVSSTARQVVDTAQDAASAVADTTVDVAQRVAATAGDVTEEVTERAGDLVSSVSDFVSERPIVALGISLAAGSLLQQYLRGGSAGAGRSYSRQATYGSTYTGYRPDYDLARGADAAARAGAAAGEAVRDTAEAVTATARTAGYAAADMADRAVDTTVDAAAGAVDTAVDAAQSAGAYVADAAQSAGAYVADAADQVVDTVSDLWPALTRQVQERPLASLGVTIAAGMLLQPVAAPHVSALSADVRDLWRTVSGATGDLLSLPEQPEVQRIKDAIVPATVERSRQFISRDMRDYLETNLEGVVGQASLRAGVVAAVAEQAEKLVDSYLPGWLNSLSGTPALLVLGLTGSALEARNQAQQGQGQTIANVRQAFAQSIVQNAQQQLSRYFPEFRQEMQAQESSAQSCSNCGTQLSPGTRFCSNCGMAVTGGTSV